MWQEVAVGIIGIITLLYVGWKVYRNFINPIQTNDHPCSKCSGCTLKKHNKFTYHKHL